MFDGTISIMGSWHSMWNVELRMMTILELKGELQEFLVNCVGLLFLSFLFLCNFERIHFSWAHIKLTISSSFLGGFPLFWRGKCAIRCKTWMQRFNSISGYYIFTCLSTSFMSLVLVIFIIVIELISMNVRLCMISQGLSLENVSQTFLLWTMSLLHSTSKISSLC